jgi:hypothetical protein
MSSILLSSLVRKGRWLKHLRSAIIISDYVAIVQLLSASISHIVATPKRMIGEPFFPLPGARWLVKK